MPRLYGVRLAGSAGRVLAAAVALACSANALDAAPIIPPDVLAPHRAIYDLSLLESRDRSGVKQASGRLVYEFTRTGCHSFTLNYRQVLSIAGGDDGKGGVIDFRSSTVEDDEAKTFSFTSTSQIAGGQVTKMGGLAERLADGKIHVTIQDPAPREVTLPASVLFPTEHLRRILAAARNDDFSLQADVYDGGEPGDAASPSLTMIGAVRQPGETNPDALSAPAGLDKLPRWPISVSYFDQKPSTGGEQTPKFIFAAEVYENGISRALRLDYGSFVVSGKLVGLEKLSADDCPIKH